MKFIRFVLSAIVFMLFFAVILTSIVLLSAGLLAIVVSITVMTGFFTTVASDLSPLAMLLTGVSCIGAGLAAALGVVVLFVKQPYMFTKP
jgi:hypothetical protein